MNGGRDGAIPHIHLVSSEFPPSVRGGAGIHVYELHHRLSQVTDVSVTLLRNSPREQSPSIPLPVPAQSQRYRVRPTLAGSFAQETFGQVVHTHSMAAHIAAMRSGRSYLSTVHSIEADRPWRAARHGGLFERAVDTEMAALNAASTVICVSQAIARDLAKHYGIERSHVVPPAYKVAQWYHDVGCDALPQQVPWDRPFVLATGRISKQKGYRYLFAALRRLRRPTTFVARAGSPESDGDAAEFRTWLAKVPEQHTVVWLKSGLGRRGMRQLYSKAALHVSPAIYEPFGLSNVESLLCGTPVCATAVGGTPQALGGTPAILLPDPADDPSEFVDRLAEVLETAPYDRELRDQTRAPTTRHILAEGDWHRVLPRMLQIYGEAVDG
ncbi:glycogen synthase [Planotetraspora thailandica]|uniref:Glycogen synthase n=1 Tax=Planotetraspora thailandica TaxID=487172 RepID=A0A8J3V4S2_9ACTN|nr:glycosyltransferase family 4 protein [Planotetraspora thailandica]GII56080.1 glycogen synthase [Planotetraspora thailandica]